MLASLLTQTLANQRSYSAQQGVYNPARTLITFYSSIIGKQTLNRLFANCQLVPDLIASILLPLFLSEEGPIPMWDA